MFGSDRAQPHRVTLGIELFRVRGRDLRVESGEPLGHGVEVLRALLGSRRIWVPDARVLGDLRPAARRPGPAIAQPGDREPSCAAVTGLAERKYQARRQMLHHARLELTGMIARLVEE